ncbi:amidohydrolase family protein [Paraburkholderia sp. ZP32-5]|uniref:amidohydrolase family protein n=1 Tax=Paraburkholderia sp. ZP32-5 TaxID=2883245 RepID=UPI001F2E6F25|nr:amidohydrolase family protein [Paraburkholderia sp. ZP32-5]
MSDAEKDRHAASGGEPPVCQTPDASPVALPFALPPGACDCHAHIYGPPERYPYRAGRRYTPAPVGLAEYRAALAALGLTRAVIVQPTIYDDNQITLDALAASGGQWCGIAQLKTDVSDAQLQLLDAAGFRGVRMHTRSGLDDLELIARRVAQFGWHVQLHLDAHTLPDIGARLARLPVPVVIDHFARIVIQQGVDQPGFRMLLTLLESGRCWVKLSAPFRLGDEVSPYAGVLPFARALVAARPDRLIWGSDWPHSSFHGVMPNMGVLLGLVGKWAPDAGIRDMILGSNPARLYGFE